MHPECDACAAKGWSNPYYTICRDASSEDCGLSCRGINHNEPEGCDNTDCWKHPSKQTGWVGTQ